MAPVGNVRWDSTGTQILFDLAGKIYGVAADGTNLRLVADIRPPVEALRRPRVELNYETQFDVSPVGNRLVYTTCEFPRPEREPVDIEDFELEIATTNLGGDDVQRLTANHMRNYSPSWSPDGSRIAFGDPENADGRVEWKLASMAADGSDRRQIHTNLTVVSAVPAQWSPDGSRIAVVGRANRYARHSIIDIVEVTGESPTMSARLNALVRAPATASAPSWSPDGQRLAFAKRDGDDVALFTVAADGSDLRRITGIEVGHKYVEAYPWPSRKTWVRILEWSPTGEYLLHGCGNYACVVTLDGVRVGRSPREALVASWSPDGSRIAVGTPNGHDGPYARPSFGGGFPDVLAVYTMAPDGSDAQPVAISTTNGVVRGARVPVASSPVDVAGCRATGVAEPNPADNLGLVNDCKVLLRLQDRLAGSAALNWSADRPIREWNGVRVYGSPWRVRELIFVDQGLSGVLPTELAELAGLRTLIFSGGARSRIGRTWGGEGNFLSGSIPPELGELTELVRLTIDGSLLTGEIPATLVRLAKLTELHLSNNHLSGEIPLELGQLPNLRELYLDNNQFTGPIPQELGSLRSLETLALSDNQLSGKIPLELGQLPNLQSVYLSGNDLGGCVPANLRVEDRERLDLKVCDEQR